MKVRVEITRRASISDPEGTTVARGGVGIGVDEDQLSARLRGDFTLAIRIGSGPGAARVITTDLTPDYVVFNGERS